MSITDARAPAKGVKGSAAETAFGCPREFHGSRYVYTVISPRARGLSIGVNLNPDLFCDFDCLYCEVNRSVPPPAGHLDIDLMATELRQTLNRVHSGTIDNVRPCCEVPKELMHLKHVTLSGDGEPTRCPEFHEVVMTVSHIRARGEFPFFKIILVTNASGLHLPEVREGLRFFTGRDEIWAKLDAGSEEYYRRINRTSVPMNRILDNILELGRQRPVVIQSLFPSIDGQGLPEGEVELYAQRLLALKEAGAQISLVQIYSATRPTPHSECGHLPLKTLSGIAQAVREMTGLNAEVF